MDRLRSDKRKRPVALSAHKSRPYALQRVAVLSRHVSALVIRGTGNVRSIDERIS
jgi:hypothetical protein